MTAGPEATIEREVVKDAKAAGYTVFKLTFLDANGAPDRLFGKGKRTIAIEFKRPGQPLTPQQRLRHRELELHFGWECYKCDSYYEACEILGI